MRVAFRADASSAIGSGHLMRCLSLAEALRSAGAEVAFLCRELPGGLGALVEGRGLRVGHLSGPGETPARDAEASQEALDALDWPAVDWLVVDNYALEASWQKAMRARAGAVLVIDDLGDRPHDCDLLLDQNLGASPARYEGRVSAACELLLGPRYALLRGAFAQQRARLRVRKGDVKRVLVAFGGADAGDMTARALRALEAMAPGLAAEVVMGAEAPHLEAIKRQVARAPQHRLHIQTENMAALMAAADLAIGAGGGSVWERACLGLPSMVIATAPNQEASAQTMAERGGHLYLGPSAAVSDEALAAGLELLRDNAPLRTSLSARSLELVDGRGAWRVVRAMRARAQLELRRAELGDCERLFTWRNHPRVRHASLDPSPLELETHRRWFESVLRDHDRHLLVASEGGMPLGVLRFDVYRTEAAAEVSLYLLASRLGQGWGAALLRSGEAWLRDAEPEVGSLVAQVRADNRASSALFEAEGYRTTNHVYRKPLRGGKEATHA